MAPGGGAPLLGGASPPTPIACGGTANCDAGGFIASAGGGGIDLASGCAENACASTFDVLSPEPQPTAPAAMAASVIARRTVVTRPPTVIVGRSTCFGVGALPNWDRFAPGPSSWRDRP